MMQSPTSHMPCASPRAGRWAPRLVLGTMLLLAPWVASAKEHRADEGHRRDAWAAGLRFDHLERTAHGASQGHTPSLSFEDRAAGRLSNPSGDDGDAPLPALPSAVPVTFAGGEARPAVGGAIDLVPVAAVPEPATYVLMLAGLLVVGFVAGRRPAQDR